MKPTSFSITPNWKFAAVGYDSGLLTFCDASSATVISKKKLDKMVSTLDLSDDGSTIIYSTLSPSAFVWTLLDFWDHELSKHTDYLSASRIISSGYLTCGYDGRIRLWDHNYINRHNFDAGLNQIRFDIKNDILIFNGSNFETENLAVWDLKQLHKVSERKHCIKTESLTFSFIKKFIFLGGEDGCVYVLDLDTGSTVRQLPPQNSAITCLIVSPDENWLLAGTALGEVRLWNLNDFTSNVAYQLHMFRIFYGSFSLDSSKWLCLADNGLMDIFGVDGKHLKEQFV